MEKRKRIFNIVACVALIVIVLSVTTISAFADELPSTYKSFYFPIMENTQIINSGVSYDDLDNYDNIYLFQPTLNYYNNVSIYDQARNNFRGRLHMDNFLLRPSLYNGNTLFNRLYDYEVAKREEGSNPHTIRCEQTIYGTFYSIDQNGVKIYHDAIVLEYDYTNDRIFLYGFEVDDPNNFEAINFYTIFSMPKSGYDYNNVLTNSISWEIDSPEAFNINAKIYTEDPIYIEQFLNVNGTELTNPFYTFLTMTDGHWTNVNTSQIEYNYYEQIETTEITYINNATIATYSGIYTNIITFAPITINYKEISVDNNIILNVTSENNISSIILEYNLISHYITASGELQHSYKKITKDIQPYEYISLIDLSELVEPSPYDNIIDYITIEGMTITVNSQAETKSTSNGNYEGSTRFIFEIPDTFTFESQENIFNEISNTLPDYDQSVKWNFTEWVKNMLNDVLSIEFLPLISIGAVISVIVGVALFFFFIKSFLGG